MAFSYSGSKEERMNCSTTSYLLWRSHFLALGPVPPCSFFGAVTLWVRACFVYSCPTASAWGWCPAPPRAQAVGATGPGPLHGKLSLGKRKNFSVVSEAGQALGCPERLWGPPSLEVFRTQRGTALSTLIWVLWAGGGLETTRGAPLHRN